MSFESSSPTNQRDASSPEALQSNAAATLAMEASQHPSAVKDNSSLWKTGAEFAGTFAASTAGAVAWGIGSRVGLGMPAKIAGTALVSGLTRVGVENGIEHFTLKTDERSSLAKTFAWGVVDGFSGVAGCAAESKASDLLLAKIGKSYIGPVSDEMAIQAGRKAVEGSLAAKFEYNVGRGIVGGAAGTFVWSVPHELYNNRNHLDTASGWLHTAESVGLNTGFGGLSGGVLGGAFTAVKNAGDIYGYTAAKIKGDAGVSKLDVLHFNDMHSALIGEQGSMPQLATKANELRAAAAAKGRSAMLFEAGDNFSGNVAAGYTDVGYVETKAAQMMHVDGFTAGNHVADVGNGRVDVDAWYRNINRIGKEMGYELPAVGANIEVWKYPKFIGPEGQVYKPYRVLEFTGPNGETEHVGVVGLITKDLADAGKQGDITYLDAQTEGRKWIDYLRRPTEEGGAGLNKVMVLSHLGREQDIELAKNVKGISYIMGAHSHDAEPVPIWVKNAETGWDVPILQAGSKARWLAEMNLAFKDTGAADKFRSTGRLHVMDENVKPNDELLQFIQKHISHVADLEAIKYPTQVEVPFVMEGVRGQHFEQTPLGTLVSKSVLDGVNNHLPEINAERAAQGLPPLEQMSVMLKHTGDIREGLEKGIQTRRTLSDVFLNTGSVERETSELTSATLSGRDIYRVLNFGLSDLPKPAYLEQPAAATRWQRAGSVLHDVFFGPKPEPFSDYSGNFIQTEGLRYSIDMRAPANSRVINAEVLDPISGKYVPLENNKNYQVLTLYHPLEKWGKNGIFGPGVQAGGETAARMYANAQPIQLSQVDMLAEHLSKQPTINPRNYLSNNINNLTPPPWRGTVRPYLNATGAIAVQPIIDEKERR